MVEEGKNSQRDPFSDYYFAEDRRFEKKALRKKKWRFIVDYCLSNEDIQKKYLKVLDKNPEYYFSLVHYMGLRENDLIIWVKGRMAPHEIIWGEDKKIVEDIKKKFYQLRNIELNDWKPPRGPEKRPSKLESKSKGDSIQMEFDF